MQYPFPAGKRLIFVPAAILTVVIGKMLKVDLKTDQAPQGIISFELAGSVDKARKIIAAWEAARMADRAFFSLKLDFAWIPCYSTTLSIACAWAFEQIASRGWDALARCGIPLAWAQWLAGALDVVENVALLIVLKGRVTWFSTRSAQLAAILKFALGLVGLAYSALGLLAKLAPKRDFSV
jgi:hypothetical protein